jgi:hypothetical protein
MDVNVRAYHLVQQAIGEPVPASAKKAAARKGGLKGGPARAKAITPERRTEIARKASVVRWNKSTPPRPT